MSCPLSRSPLDTWLVTTMMSSLQPLRLVQNGQHSNPRLPRITLPVTGSQMFLLGLHFVSETNAQKGRTQVEELQRVSRHLTSPSRDVDFHWMLPGGLRYFP